MPFIKQGNFTKKPADFPDVPSPTLTPTDIRSYWQTPHDELKVTVNNVVDELNTGTDFTRSTGNHLGTWQGLTPTQSDAGLAATVDSHTTQLADIVINVNAMSGATVDEQIKNAFSQAVSTGSKFVMIPAKANHGGDFVVNEAIQIPSNCTLILNGCHVKLGVGIKDNIIVNSGARTSPLSANENIHIFAIGNVIVDGLADVNKNFENLIAGSEYYNDHRRIGINLFNTKGFSISGIKVREAQGFAISIENGCSNGLIRDIEFDSTNTVINQDGLDIRKGCHDILIENISGRTGDDVVALTGLYYEDSYGKCFQVGGNATWGENDDIYNITIKNIRGKSTGDHHVLRLLNHNGIKLHDINIDGLFDNTDAFGVLKAKALLKIGDSGYWNLAPTDRPLRQATYDETYNINFKNLSSRSLKAVYFAWSCSDVTGSDIKCKDDYEKGVMFETGIFKNISIDGFFCKRNQRATIDGVEFALADYKGEPITIYDNANIEDVFFTNLDFHYERFPLLIANMDSTSVIKNFIIDGLTMKGCVREFIFDSTNVVNDLINKAITVSNITVLDHLLLWSSGDTSKIGRLASNSVVNLILGRNINVVLNHNNQWNGSRVYMKGRPLSLTGLQAGELIHADFTALGFSRSATNTAFTYTLDADGRVLISMVLENAADVALADNTNILNFVNHPLLTSTQYYYFFGMGETSTGIRRPISLTLDPSTKTLKYRTTEAGNSYKRIFFTISYFNNRYSDTIF